MGWCVSRGGRSCVLERVIGLLLVDFWGAMMVSDCAICGFDSFTFPWRWMWKTYLLPHEEFTPDPDVLVNTGFKFACSPRMFWKQWSNLKSVFADIFQQVDEVAKMLWTASISRFFVGEWCHNITRPKTGVVKSKVSQGESFAKWPSIPGFWVVGYDQTPPRTPSLLETNIFPTWRIIPCVIPLANGLFMAFKYF